jgi:hypothetical protein
MSLAKVVVMIPAAILTMRDAPPLTTTLPELDATGKATETAEMKKEHLYTWEDFRIYYSACCQALDSPDWAEPNLSFNSVLGSLTSAVGPLLSGTPWGKLLTGGLGLLSQAMTQPSNIPNPGAAPAAS